MAIATARGYHAGIRSRERAYVFESRSAVP
jgi:hypothetical protein